MTKEEKLKPRQYIVTLYFTKEEIRDIMEASDDISSFARDAILKATQKIGKPTQ